MQKIIIFIFSLFFTLSVFANSVMYAADDNLVIRADKNSTAKIIAKLNKFDKLDVVTMHYSGWSKVYFNDDVGWIKSDNLTNEAPVVKVKTTVDTSSDLVQSLNKEITVLKADLEDLGLSKNNEISAVKSNFNNEISLLKSQLNSEIKSLKTLNSKLSIANKKLSVENDSLNKKIDSADTDLLLNYLLFAAVGLVVGFILSLLVANTSKRRRDSFNTINRSY